MKYFIPLLILIIFISPQTAFANSHFSAKEHNFTVFFDENWRQFTEQDIKEFSLKDQENLFSSFFTVDKNIYLYIKKFDSSHPYAEIMHTSENYFKETPSDLFKEDRLYKPIEALIGNKIIDFSYNFSEKTFFYETEFISSAKSKYKIFSLWKMQGDSLFEFNFILYDDYKVNEETIRLLSKSIDFNFYSDTNTVPKEDNEKILLKDSNKNKDINTFMDLVLSKNMIYFLIIVFVLFFIIRIVSKNTSRI
jgi:hypothetical protein